MRIALVTPLLTRVFGNRCAFVLARELARSHEVTVVAHTVSEAAVEEVSHQIGGARLDALRRETPRPERMSRLYWWQLTRGADRALARHLRTDRSGAAYDAVVVFADEGHYVAGYLGAGASRPVTAVCLLELADHPFLLRRERPLTAARRLLMPAYPLVHFLESQRLAAFDLRFGISRWSSILAEYLYGVPTHGELSAYDDALFRPVPGTEGGEPYLALPTASLDARGLRAVELLRREGVRFVAYGPRPVPSVDHRGLVTDAEMVRILSGARGTLFLFDYEGLGLMPIESLAAGTPVITEPRQGPLEEHRGNPFVRFAGTHGERLEACHALLDRPKDPDAVTACPATVERYRPSVVARRMVEQIERVRAGRLAA